MVCWSYSALHYYRTVPVLSVCRRHDRHCGGIPAPVCKAHRSQAAAAQMAAIFGSTRLREAAASLNRSISLPERIPARSWRDLRQFLDGGSRDDLPDTLFDLLDRCLGRDGLTMLLSHLYSSETRRTETGFQDHRCGSPETSLLQYVEYLKRTPIIIASLDGPNRRPVHPFAIHVRPIWNPVR